ncbi:coatomer subunit zeta-1 [Pyxicephalus adspersus]|uniref:coatomer subunit zeta-1 n=1 Tax=Pyxicephalus adspersus TaxID=30357 RepID=UPI003B5B4447
MEAVLLDPTLYTVKAVLILDNDGERLFAKYYDETYPTVKEQKSFEKNIFNKTHRTDSEIALLEGLTVVYKSSIDLYFYVIGSSHENELMLMAVLNCLFDSLSQMLRYGDDVPLTEQTVSQVLQSAKEQIKWSLLR